MTLKRWLATALAATVFAFAAVTVAAQEPDPTAVPTDDAAQKPGFWGNEFALYIETQTGAASSDPVSTTMFTLDNLGSISSVTLEDQAAARIAVGWKLPEGRGKFLVVWEGLKETEWSFRGTGLKPNLAGTSRQAGDLVTWWNVEINGGTLTSQAQIPTWVEDEDDVNENSFPDPEEIRIEASPLGTTRSVVETLENQVQTLDAMYTRPFGGRWINAGWGVGMRYFVYDGNMPATAWLQPARIREDTEGFTDGANLRLLNFNQATTGFGPAGFTELRLNFFRDRLTLYWIARAAFIIADVETDTGDFFTYVRNSSTQTITPVAARIQELRSKDIWQTGAEGGVRVRLVDNLVLHLGYFLNSYQDAVLIPSRISIPETTAQAPQGVTALYRTRDIRVDGWRGGFSFQF